MDGLKPCPFCGGDAYTLNQAPNGTGYSVGCDDDECRGFIALSWIYATEAEAIEAWNTRADDYRHAAEYWQRMYEKAFAERTCRNESADGFLCSACSFGDFASFKFEPNYCPNCGARVVSE